MATKAAWIAAVFVAGSGCGIGPKVSPLPGGVAGDHEVPPATGTPDGGGVGDAFEGGSDHGQGSANSAVSGTRLKARVLVASDGAALFLGWRDTERNEDCGFSMAVDGKMRCMPEGAPATLNYSDTGCRTPIVAAAKGCAPPTYVVLVAATVGCEPSSSRQLFRPGGIVFPTTIYAKLGSGCTSLGGPSSAYDYYFVGTDEVLPSLFVDATEQLR